jgi:hypothetical protein
VRRLKDFASIVALLGDREIDDLQTAIDERLEVRTRRPDAPASEADPSVSETSVHRTS